MPSDLPEAAQIDSESAGRSAWATSPTFVSLFCGAGGFDLGFVNAGFECIAAYDNDPYSIATHHLNFGLRAELADLASEQLSVPPAQTVDVVIAGPPCQGFSTLGRRRIEDPRNSLLISAGRLALSLAPRIVVVENVPGAISGSHASYWNQLRKELETGGYHTVQETLHSADYSLPQSRKRIILVAFKDVASPNLPPPHRTPLTLQRALTIAHGEPDHHPEPLPSGPLRSIALRLEPGQKLCNVRGGPNAVHTWHIPEVFGPVTSHETEVLLAFVRLRRRLKRAASGDAVAITSSDVSSLLGRPSLPAIERLIKKGYLRRKSRRYDLADAFNGKPRRLKWDRPAPTVDTRFGDPRYFLHPTEHRGLTVREAARIQGFPDSFRFAGPAREKYRQIGNAVPPPLSNAIAVEIRHALEESH